MRSAPRVGRSGTTESETRISGRPDRSVGDAETRLNFALPLKCVLVFVGARFFSWGAPFRGARLGDCKGRRTRWDSVAILGFHESHFLAGIHESRDCYNWGFTRDSLGFRIVTVWYSTLHVHGGGTGTGPGPAPAPAKKTQKHQNSVHVSDTPGSAKFKFCLRVTRWARGRSVGRRTPR